MTTEQINVAISEACGWTDFSQGMEGLIGVRPKKNCWNDGRHPVPNYCSDLNACADFEETLSSGQCVEYDRVLQEIVLRDAAKTNRSFAQDRAWNATASQRAEAFLKTIVKWEDSK